MSRVLAALMRHSEFSQARNVPAAHQPHALTERGEAQAREAAVRLLDECASAGWFVDPIIESSRMLRAWQTARIIAEVATERLGRRFEVREADDLAERCVGAAANLTVQQIEALVREDPRYEDLPGGWKAMPSIRLPFQGAESLLEAGRRVALHVEGSLARLASEAEREVLRLFVGHGAAIRFAAVHWGLLAAAEATGLTMRHGGHVTFARTGSGTFDHVAGAFKVRDRNVAAAD